MTLTDEVTIQNSSADYWKLTDWDLFILADRTGKVMAINSSGGMQSFAFNMRRPKFADPRVRRAFNFALNFEEMNRQMFFSQYKRIKSYFEGMELASSGLPEGAEKRPFHIRFG